MPEIGVNTVDDKETFFVSVTTWYRTRGLQSSLVVHTFFSELRGYFPLNSELSELRGFFPLNSELSELRGKNPLNSEKKNNFFRIEGIFSLNSFFY